MLMPVALECAIDVVYITVIYYSNKILGSNLFRSLHEDMN